jgi:hypothetical protein
MGGYGNGSSPFKSLMILFVAVFFCVVAFKVLLPSRSDEKPLAQRILNSFAAGREKALADGRAQVRPQGCRQGFVWREAYAGDDVCVTTKTRSATSAQNREADTRKRSGLEECREGYTWRLAGPNDHVCVPPEDALQAYWDNAQASSRQTN